MSDYAFSLGTSTILSSSGEFSPQVSSDDGYGMAHYPYAWSPPQFNNSATYIQLTGSLGVGRIGYVRFPNVTVPQGATITNCYLRGYVRRPKNSGHFYGKIYFNDTNDAVAPSSWSQLDALALTDGIEWDWPYIIVEGGTELSPSLIDIFQPIINRSDWEYGNAVMFVMEKLSGSDGQLITLDGALDGYDDSYITKLYVEYDYLAPVPDSEDFTFAGSITLENNSEVDLNSYPIRLELDSSNFNFDIYNGSGDDFVIADGKNVLYSYKASWTAGTSALFLFKIPSLSAGSEITLNVFWEYTGDALFPQYQGPDNLGFLFYDPYTNDTRDENKWDASNYTIGSPLSSVKSWQMRIYSEAGELEENTSSRWSAIINFDGIDWDFAINMYKDRCYHNYVDGSYVWYWNYEYWDGSSDSTFYCHGGPEEYSPNVFTLSYYEETDRLYWKMSGRNTKDDCSISWEHKGVGNTEITRVKYTTQDTQYQDPLAIKAPGIYFVEYYGPDAEFLVDASGLYFQYEPVAHPTLATGTYTGDLTDYVYYHETDLGGEPRNLSNNSNSIVWEGTTTSGYVFIDFGRYYENLASFDYIHYDNGHETYFGAAKLSDSDLDINNNNYWYGTTTSGWAAIDFSSIKKVGVLSLTAVSGSLDNCPKNFRFEGSQSDPRFYDSWSTLYTGQMQKQVGWQTFHFTNGRYFRYYRLYVEDTYGDNIKLQEWRMYEFIESPEQVEKKAISLIKLKPPSNKDYFPKQVEIQASDGVTWTTLVSGTSTYTPTDLSWQEFAFDNSTSYWMYKINLSGNWGGTNDKVSIAEWTMHERIS